LRARRSIVVVDNFYRNPSAVRSYALSQSYYTPYERTEDIQAGRCKATWWASRFKPFRACPFKSGKSLRSALERAVGETIDLDHWRAPFPVDAESRPIRLSGSGCCSCLWNCCFHVKPANAQKLGDGVHNHVTDGWNSVGEDGWAGIIYFSPESPPNGGLHLWRNTDPAKKFDWMTPATNWELVDSFGNLFNRLLLVRGDIPHSGACGWGNRIENGRMYQTFFFKTNRKRTLVPVSLQQVEVLNVSAL
jgi:hypothetical protein